MIGRLSTQPIAGRKDWPLELRSAPISSKGWPVRVVWAECIAQRISGSAEEWPQKVLPAELSGSFELRDRLEREAKILSSLNHPHICTLYDIGREADLTYLVMEYLQGETLRERLQRGRIPNADLFRLAIPLTEALHAAHSLGIIHCDIKPANIFITDHGQPKLLDFGIARRRQQARRVTADVGTAYMANEITHPGAIIGTESYMSPEQALGRELDGRTDVFSFGVVLYEMATGVHPFHGDTAPAVFDAILNRNPQVQSALNSGLDPGWGSILLKTLEKDPDLRFQTALDLRDSLALLRDGGEATVTERPMMTGERTQRTFRFVPFAALPAILLGLLTYNWIRPAARNFDSLAILPFVNASGDPNQEDLSDGISENLIDALSHIPKLRLTARSISFRYRGPQVDPQKVGRELHVRAVLTGRVAERAGSLNVLCELINVEDGSRIWAGQYSRESRDLLLLQQDIARQLAAKMRLNATAEEQSQLAKPTTENGEAYRLYLKGRYYWDRRTVSTLKRSIGYFQQAIDKDPAYAQAYAALAECYAVFAGHEVAAPKDSGPQAKAAAALALQIDSTLAGAHAAMAFAVMQLDWDWENAEKEFQQAIRFGPDYATAYHWYGVFLSLKGRSEQGIALLRRAQQLEPLSLIISASLARELYHARHYDEAIAEIHKALEMDPNFPTLHWWLGLPYEQKGMYREAVAEFQKAADLSGGSPYALGALGHAYAILGKRAKARQIAAELRELAQHRYVSPFDIGLIYAALGDREQTFEWLETALEDRSWGVMFLKVDPRFDHLRSDPRLHDLMRRMKLESATN